MCLFGSRLPWVPFALLGACGGEGRAVPSTCSDRRGDPVLQQRVDHACLHTEAGPFAFVETALLPDPIPELRHAHTGYTLQLVDTPAGWFGTATLKARAPSVFAFYLRPDTAMAVRQQEGPAICTVAAGPVGGCARLAGIRAFPLEGGREYLLTFGPAAERTILVVMESETASEVEDPGRP